MVFEAKNLTISYSGALPNVPFLPIKEKILGKKYDLSIAFVSPKIALSLNQNYRQKDYIPNTLSFSLTEESGEIILCKSILKKEYKKFEMNYLSYVTLIVIHSMLHLKGMEHGVTMEDEEKRYLSYFTEEKIPDETKHNSRH